MLHARVGWIGLFAIAFSSLAPAEEPRLVSVTIMRVADDVARNIGVDASQIPLNVTVPLDVAATVCGVASDVLARQADSGVAQCTAQRTSSGLDNVVMGRVRGNGQR